MIGERVRAISIEVVKGHPQIVRVISRNGRVGISGSTEAVIQLVWRRGDSRRWPITMPTTEVGGQTFLSRDKLLKAA